jgi:hypothetical protein
MKRLMTRRRLAAHGVAGQRRRNTNPLTWQSVFPSNTYDKDRNKIITSAQIAALNTDYHMMVGKWWPDQMKQYGF